ncbi:MAG: cysteine methyltransferase [Armatimonadetes bacterium]|jgi:methylated-DNA-[protein]-cysteine S-methyltransferase|nr:cysteine methyltransferase [Armatimonadota bacterium]
MITIETRELELLGPVTVAAREEGLLQIALGDPATAASRLGRRYPREAVRAEGPHCEATFRQLAEYLAGERTIFDLPTAFLGTPFQREVWDAVAAIPFGETRSYAQIAALVGRPAAIRAAGAANGANPLCIVIPCHRVVASDGKLTGYAYGLELKKALLDFEANRSG